MEFSKENVKVLLFDLGGVILEVKFANALETWSAYASTDSAVLKTRFNLDGFYEQHERGEITASAYFETLRQSLGIQLTDEQFSEGWNALALGEMPEVRMLLQHAKMKFALYAFSNTNFTHLEHITSHYADVLKLFIKLFASCEMGKRKPTLEAFELVAKEIGVQPHEILFFDDLLENVAGARGAGLQAVHVTSVEDTKKALEYLGAIS
jgi:glucose-1-phosphatase